MASSPCLPFSPPNAMAVRTAKTNKPITIRRWRMNTVLLAAVLALGGVGMRLGNLQIVQHDSLSKQARGEINQQIQLAPRRGTIRDRAGNVLALDVDRESVFVVPQQINQQNAP